MYFMIVNFFLSMFFVLAAQTVRQEQCSRSVLSRELGVTGVPRRKGNSLSFGIVKIILTL